MGGGTPAIKGLEQFCFSDFDEENDSIFNFEDFEDNENNEEKDFSMGNEDKLKEELQTKNDRIAELEAELQTKNT